MATDTGLLFQPLTVKGRTLRLKTSATWRMSYQIKGALSLRKSVPM